MNEIEIIICLLLLFMSVPDLCGSVGRPALAYPVFVVSGLLLAPFAEPAVHNMLVEAGHVGFLLLLFEVGLEIELPRLRVFARPLARAFFWSLVQYPLVFALAYVLAGLRPVGCFIACAAFTGCSVGMGYPGWKNYPGLAPDRRRQILLMMLALEIFSIVLLSVETTLYQSGVRWVLVAQLAGIVAVVGFIGWFSRHLKTLFGHILKRTTHWRVHLIVLLVLVVCAIGQRLGLSAIKTAFFLGLFLSRITHEGRRLEHFIAPISRRFLIPIFFFALGLQIPREFLFSPPGLGAFAAAAAVLLLRWGLHRFVFSIGGDRRAFLLLCPNLTIAALAAGTLLHEGTSARAASWVLLTGLFITIPSIFLLPGQKEDEGAPGLPRPNRPASRSHPPSEGESM
ncbi:MAG: cation:proton antiporter [Opitutaceae bacterium]|jgi:Kef-type K+ transport system membrane component KefB|nr:cation:proton antiporter [Opitutaceae bacterium]